MLGNHGGCDLGQGMLYVASSLVYHCTSTTCTSALWKQTQRTDGHPRGSHILEPNNNPSSPCVGQCPPCLGQTPSFPTHFACYTGTAKPMTSKAALLPSDFLSLFPSRLAAIEKSLQSNRSLLSVCYYSSLSTLHTPVQI